MYHPSIRYRRAIVSSERHMSERLLSQCSGSCSTIEGKKAHAHEIQPNLIRVLRCSEPNRLMCVCAFRSVAVCQCIGAVLACRIFNRRIVQCRGFLLYLALLFDIENVLLFFWLPLHLLRNIRRVYWFIQFSNETVAWNRVYLSFLGSCNSKWKSIASLKRFIECWITYFTRNLSFVYQARTGKSFFSSSNSQIVMLTHRHIERKVHCLSKLIIFFTQFDG